MPILKNPRHERFAQELAKGKTATEAYVLAGYKANDGNAATLKGNQRILDRLAEIAGKAADRAEITIARVLEEMGRIAFADLRAVFNDDGSLKAIDEWPADVALAISGIETDELFEGTGKDRKSIGVTRKVKLWDKPRALDMLGKYFGMFIERHEHSGNIEITKIERILVNASNTDS